MRLAVAILLLLVIMLPFLYAFRTGPKEWERIISGAQYTYIGFCGKAKQKYPCAEFVKEAEPDNLYFIRFDLDGEPQEIERHSNKTGKSEKIWKAR